MRELVALDGTDMSEFMLIDTDGCPTDLAIMKPIAKSGSSGQILETQFEAFKFPTSDLVQFKALVTPCVANCEPSKCNLNLPSGRTSQTLSFGRRRRREAAADSSNAKVDPKAPVLEDSENVVVVESLSVTDKFTAPKKERKKIEEDDNSEVFSSFEGKVLYLTYSCIQSKTLCLLSFYTEEYSKPDGWSRMSRLDGSASCLNLLSVTIFGVAFLVAQTVLLISWSIVCSRAKRSKQSSLLENELMYGGSSNWLVHRGSLSSGAPQLPAPSGQSGKSQHYAAAYTDTSMLYPSCNRQSPSASYNIYS